MAKRMLIDATHPEETRVVVLNGNRLEEFDFESSTKQQVKGNIYLAKVTRVEPSLQAAFVEYGGNRHGFLAFSEIHPDYFRIPVGDRERAGDGGYRGDLAGLEIGAEDAGVPLAAALPEPVAVVAAPTGADDPVAEEPAGGDDRADGEKADGEKADGEKADGEKADGDTELGFERSWGAAPGTADESTADESSADESTAPGTADESMAATGAAASVAEEGAARAEAARAELPWEDVTPFVPVAPDAGAAQPGFAPISAASPDMPGEPVGYAALRAGDSGAEMRAVAAADRAPATTDDIVAEAAETTPELARARLEGETSDPEIIETLGGDEFEEAERQRSRAPRHYKIQEVVKRRQIMLVQVTKEERGNKGAALTTYLSLAGRYCVLMPNTARGGGVSRKITSISDRRRLKDILEELDIPEGMGVIVRTAGAERSKAEIKRDYEYLLRLWNEIRELTLRSTAPALIYEEGNLIKRSIRDLYTRDIDEVLVEGEDGYRTAKSFMKMLMPSHAKRVQPYRDPQIGLLHRFQVESQIDAIHSPIVQLRSGGYVVINQTEALVAIDVNSGRSTRERNIEETALRTNLEAAEEIARQLRLRDLAGLIVIDFIDMEEHRNQGAVERRLKDALKNDRARIQVGRISPFGLLEMSRQRLRPSLVEASTQPCPHCGGTGFIRSTESTALYVLRSIEEEGMRRRSAEVCVHVPTTVALYILNHKRDSLAQLETRYGVHVLVARDDALIPPAFRLERLRTYEPGEAAPAVPLPLTQAPELEEEEPEEEDAGETEAAEAEPQGREDDEERGRGRRRRRRRRRHEDERGAPASPRATEDGAEPSDESVAASGRVAGAEHGGAMHAGEAEADAAGAGAETRDGEVQDGDSQDGDAQDGDAQDGDAQGEDDKLRRRRGRRGGRRRGRREEIAGPSFEDPRPASETIEVAAMPGEDEPADEVDPRGEGDPPQLDDGDFAAGKAVGASAAAAAWPADAQAADGIETTSLPALAREAAPSRSSPAAAEPAEPSRTILAVDDAPGDPVWAPIASGGEAAPEGGTEPGSARHSAAEAEPSGYRENTPQGEVTEPSPATPPAGRQPPALTQSPVMAEPQPEPAPKVQTVTEKPPSPRRGWWQRLMQS
jgi:ribonuclease E